MDAAFSARRLPRGGAVLVVISAAVVLGLWMLGTPAGVLGKASAVGYAICHQIAVRSFQIGTAVMPLCARCTGIYLGVVTGLLFMFISGRRKVCQLPGRNVALVLSVFIVVMVIDGVNSYIHLFPGGTGVYEPHNWLRLVTGIYCGFAVINLVYPVFNGVIWQEPQDARAIQNLQELAGLCAVLGFVVLLVLSERPTFLFILALASVFGVIAMLTMIGTVLFVSLLKLENSFRSWRGLIVPLLAGLTVTFVLIGGIDALRLLLTGTWAGFNIGS